MTDSGTHVYSVLKCKPIHGTPWSYDTSSPSKKLSYSHASPHYHIISEVDGGQQYTIVINIESSDHSSPMLLYYIDKNYNNPITSNLLNTFSSGYSIIESPSSSSGIVLDYVKGNLFDHSKMLTEEHLSNGEDSLNFIIDSYVKNSIEVGADIYAFGTRFADTHVMGMHDIHMNQGNEKKYESEDRVYQDGGLLIHNKSQNIWTAMFFAFRSQSFKTDENGHRVD